MLSLADQQQLSLQIPSYFFMEAKDSEPPALLSELLKNGSPLCQLRFLSDPLANHSQITNKGKLNRLVKCLTGLVEQPETVIEEILSTDQN